MKTEYILSDEQKKEIAELELKIFDLNMKIASIYAKAPVRYITETKEEADGVRKYLYYSDKLLDKQSITFTKHSNEHMKERVI